MSEPGWPWEGAGGNDELMESTAEMLEVAEEESRAMDADEYWDKIAWDRLANRLKADGTLIR